MSTIHVMPVADLVDHDPYPDCVCGPHTEPVWRDDGSNGWLVVHTSLDGRDANDRRIDTYARDVAAGWDDE